MKQINSSETEVTEKEFHIHIRSLSSQEGGGYLATIPALPGCMADGESREEAIREISDAAESWLQTAEEFHDPVINECKSNCSPNSLLLAGGELPAFGCSGRLGWG